jgi:hypothetical protein
MVADEPNTHRVDAADRISLVNEPWLAFARENGASGLTAAAVLGRPLWDFIGGDDVHRLFRALMRQVRDQQRPIQLPFCCDAPGLEREMRLELLPLAAGGIEFRSHLEALTPRPPVALLDTTRPRAAWHVPMCSWCKRVEVAAGRWEDTVAGVDTLRLFASAPIPRLVHTVCPDCMAAIRARAPDGDRS